MSPAERGARDAAEALEPAIGHRFADRALLAEAMTHPSINPEHRGAAAFGYERLEFLGDRVLALVIAEWLLQRFPHEHEGPLAKRHVAMVRREALADVAERIDLGRHLILSSGEEGSGGRANAAILADACEALIGALFIDGGLEAARGFIRSAWAEAIERDARPPQDPKTRLQEWVQARGLALPRYETVDRTGPDHQPVFEVRVVVEGREPAAATGSSKREAAKKAAEALLARLDGA
ncbi:MAG: ribonuclease III [Alphaproteobacteria bacterium]|jgi:ribonuclease-3|nr:ribonuclease III [Alphaproteobacteria bacterium]